MRATAFAALLFMPVAALSQTGGGIDFTSDDRYRGVSLSDRQPTLRVSASHDSDTGWYAGASLAGVSLDPPHRQAQMLAYAGRAGALDDGLGGELGIVLVHFSGGSRFDYHEWLGGLSGSRWSARLYLSPNYFGSGLRTAYAELNAGAPISADMQLSAHLGALARWGHAAAADTERSHVDARVGVGWLGQPWGLQLDWVAGSPAGIYPVSYRDEHSVLVLSASCAF